MAKLAETKMSIHMHRDNAMAGEPDGAGARIGGWRKMVWGAAAFLWLVPLVAMQFTTEVNWDAADFIIWALMLLAAAGTYELASRMTRNRSYRMGVGIAVVAAFLLVWINGAVGIIGSEDNPANLMYLGVLAVAIIGSLLARFQSLGVARAMTATALAQTLVALIALIAGLGSAADILGLTGFFALLWLASAQLFRTAARGGSEPVPV